jgi:ABC-2 type transport system permease protein
MHLSMVLPEVFLPALSAFCRKRLKLSFAGGTRRLGLKELVSLAGDTVLLLFIAYSFSFMIYSEATGVESEVRNANIAVVDGDHSVLSRRLRDAMQAPQFKPAVVLDRSHTDGEMDRGRFTFVLDIPPQFEADVLRGRRPELQLNIDATAMS